MLASLDCFDAQRFCRQQDLSQLVTLLGLERLDVDLVRSLDLNRAAFRHPASALPGGLTTPGTASREYGRCGVPRYPWPHLRKSAGRPNERHSVATGALTVLGVSAGYSFWAARLRTASLPCLIEGLVLRPSLARSVNEVQTSFTWGERTCGRLRWL
jgi:hypothetical protein